MMYSLSDEPVLAVDALKATPTGRYEPSRCAVDRRLLATSVSVHRWMRWVVAVGLLIVAMSTASSVDAYPGGHDRPFRAAGFDSGPIQPDGSFLKVGVITGTHFGRGTNVVVGTSGQGFIATVTAANGDTWISRPTGPRSTHNGCPAEFPLSFRSAGVIDGGTGRFAEATGDIEFIACSSLTPPDSNGVRILSTHFSVTGTISY